MKKEVFIKKLSEEQIEKYDYSKVPEEFSVKDKICIVCPIHGEFMLRVDGHIANRGCPKCGHIKTGLATRTKDLNIGNTKDILLNINIIKDPKIPYENYIIGSIYLLINDLNNKIYVGQTYNRYTERWSLHKNANDTFYIHTAIKKYGWDNFSKYVIFLTDYYLYNEDNIKKINDILNEKEKYYISFFKTEDSKYGYNLTPGGKDDKTIHLKTSKKQFSKRVEQYDLLGNLIKVWDSVKEIYTTTDFKKDGIADCSNGKRDFYKGYIWKIIDPKKEEIKHKSITAPKEILLYDLEGNFINSYSSSLEAALSLKCSSSPIRACCRGDLNISNNFIWIFKNGEISNKLPLEYLEERNLDSRILQIDLSGNIINIWKNCADAGKELGFNSSNLAQCVRGNNKTSYGYFWKKFSLRELVNMKILDINYKLRIFRFDLE